MLAGAPPDPPPGQQPASDPLVRLLQAKGVLSAEEAQELAAVPAMQQRDQLTALLLKKGVISTNDLQGVSTSNGRLVGFSSSTATLKPAVLVGAVQTAAPAQAAAPPAPPKPPAIIAAIAPIRVLQLESAKPGGLVPDIKLGSGAKLKLYGFLKASVVHDTSSQQGNDFPLPQFLGDTGPNGSPEFHIKARAARVGFNFEWPDVAKDLSLTGRLEFDFEGNFPRVNNRNISSIRSSQPSIRLAWMRLDKIINPNTSVYLLAGQDWNPFGSSTLPNLLETTALGIGFGSLYERAPQLRVGIVQKLGGSRNVVLSLEPAITLPAFGNLPTDLGNQLGYGERQGVDSQRPQIEGRVVMQFQLDKAKGVAPAQIIFSGMQGQRKEIVIASAVPVAFRPAFPTGAELTSSRYGINSSIQLPTRWFTLLASAYQGEDLRFFFAGQIFSEFNNFAGFTGSTLATAAALDGTTVWFGSNASGASLVPQNGVRAVGGFVNLGLPLSRLANARPEGRGAGWTMYLHYGMDNAYAADVRRAAFTPAGGLLTNAGAGARWRSDLMAGNLQYKMNAFVTFGYEVSRYSTRSVRGLNGGNFPLAVGIPQHEFHDLRSEFATIFTF
jgi:hypothetical protein